MVYLNGANSTGKEEFDQIVKAKQQLRSKIFKLLAAQSPVNRRRASEKIAAKLFDLTEFKQAKTIMFYVSTDGEVETEHMIKYALSTGKIVAIPVSKVEERKLITSRLIDFDKELQPGPYGILQPKEEFIRQINPEEIELVIVPGVAFTRTGQRLGRGKGYYDRFLSSLPENTPKIGLAFHFQIVESLPCCPHDFTLTSVVSD